MSYTKKVVKWEQCASQHAGTTVQDLLESENNNVLDILSRQLQVPKDRVFSIMNIYGDIERLQEMPILARKQPKEEVINTPDGKTLLTKSTFYVDPYVSPSALLISKMDKLDGETIEQIYVMCDLYNRPKMIRFITV